MARAAEFSEASASAGEESGSGAKPTLYHATAMIRSEETGEYNSYPENLNPREQKTISGRKGKFVFAGASLLMAVAYSLKTLRDDEEVAHLRQCGAIQNGIPIAIIDDYEKFTTQHPKGIVLKLPNDSFKQELLDGRPSGEWVSETGVKTEEFIRDITPEFAMRSGVQIFIYSPSPDPEDRFKSNREFYYAKEEYKKKAEEIKNTGLSEEELSIEVEKLWIETLKEAVEAGTLIHFNRERGLNPMDLDERILEDMSYLEDPSKILELPKLRLSPSTSVRTPSGSAVAVAELDKGRT